MRKVIKQRHTGDQAGDRLLSVFIRIEKQAQKLPELSPIEKVKLDTDIDLDHLYHSSKIEGTNLSATQLTKAIAA